MGPWAYWRSHTLERWRKKKWRHHKHQARTPDAADFTKYDTLGCPKCANGWYHASHVVDTTSLEIPSLARKANSKALRALYSWGWSDGETARTAKPTRPSLRGRPDKSYLPPTSWRKRHLNNKKTKRTKTEFQGKLCDASSSSWTTRCERAHTLAVPSSTCIYG